MVVFSTLYGGLIAYRSFGFQADVLSDIVKVSVVVGLATGIFAFVFWSLMIRKHETYIRAAIAGILTAIFVLPAPSFVWALKTQIRTALNSEAGMALSEMSSTFTLTAENFLWSFSLAEAITLPMSAVVGLFVIWRS